MTSNPDEIRAEIERTRANLSDDVNALADEANPKNIARRQVDKVKDGAVSVKDRIMGTASDVAEAASDKVSALGDKASAVGDRAGDRTAAVGDAVSGAPATVKRKAQGNPLGAGLVAFGLGFLVSSLIPASDREQHVAAGVKEKVEPLKEKLTEVGKDAASNLKAPVQDAVASVKDTATESVQNVKEEGSSAASDVQGQVQDSKESVQATRNS
jgi:gas vesicle protein